jgi:hypothetical protein
VGLWSEAGEGEVAACTRRRYRSVRWRSRHRSWTTAARLPGGDRRSEEQEAEVDIARPEHGAGRGLPAKDDDVWWWG